MTVERIAISLEKSLARRVRRSAASQPISAWIAEAVEAKLRSEGLGEVVAEFERVHGVITEREMEAVRREQRAAIKRAKLRRRR